MTGASLPAVPGLRLGPRPQLPRDARRDDLGSRWFGADRGRYREPRTLDRFADRLAKIRRLADVTSRSRPGAAKRPAGLAPGDLTVTFAALVNASREIYGFDLHDEQLFAAWSLVHGRLVEMQTGEGKTLTAGLAATAVALTGTPVHVLTVNEYLAARDAEILAPLYLRFGLRGAAVLAAQSDQERRAGYAHAISHLAHRQVIFDWLRDRETHGEDATTVRARLSPLYDTVREPPVLRGLCFAIVDEADSVLVDEALTPFVLATGASDRGDESVESATALSIARTLRRGRDFELDDANGDASLTDDGERVIAEATSRLGGVWRHRAYRGTRIVQALSALHHFTRDRHYLVRDGRVALIDQATGRVAADRRLQHGLHSMIEVKERVETSVATVATAAISAQDFYPRYRRLCGLSGTLSGLQRELRHVYGLRQITVPPHRPIRRRALPPVVLSSEAAQFARLARLVSDRQHRGQAVLIGTRTVDCSERVSTLLKQHGIDHDLLNARQDAGEAAIVARAGEPGAVTVATNMAGRGTDIPVSALVKARGGLLVLSIEANPSSRLDRQLFGRAGRQGDPGAAQHLLSLDDELFRERVPKPLLALAARLCDDDRGLSDVLARSLLKLAQDRAVRSDARHRRRVHDAREQIEKLLAVAGRAGES